MAAVTVVLSTVMAAAGGWPMGLVAALHLGGVTVLIHLFGHGAPASAISVTGSPSVQPPFSDGEARAGGP